MAYEQDGESDQLISKATSRARPRLASPAWTPEPEPSVGRQARRVPRPARRSRPVQRQEPPGQAPLLPSPLPRQRARPAQPLNRRSQRWRRPAGPERRRARPNRQRPPVAVAPLPPPRNPPPPPPGPPAPRPRRQRPPPPPPARRAP